MLASIENAVSYAVVAASFGAMVGSVGAAIFQYVRLRRKMRNTAKRASELVETAIARIVERPPTDAEEEQSFREVEEAHQRLLATADDTQKRGVKLRLKDVETVLNWLEQQRKREESSIQKSEGVSE